MNLWWGLLVSSTLFGRYAGSRHDDAETLAQIQSAVVRCIAADILAVAAAVYFAVRLTSMRRLKASEGPFRTAGHMPAPSS